jgi:hypothetical protein
MCCTLYDHRLRQTVSCYNATMIMMSPGKRNFPALLWSYGLPLYMWLSLTAMLCGSWVCKHECVCVCVCMCVCAHNMHNSPSSYFCTNGSKFLLFF